MYGVTQYTAQSYSGTATVATSGNSSQLCNVWTPVGASGNRPCVVFIHGGAWLSGGYGAYNQLGYRMAQMGYVACSINYRWSPGGSTANGGTATNTSVWPAQMNDCQLAVRWLRSQATTFGIDTSRFVTWGDSAGSHLALMLLIESSIHAAPSGDSTGTVSSLTGYSSQVQVCIDQFGPADLTTIYNTSDTAGFQAVQYLLGGNLSFPPTGNAALYADGSPVSQISGGTGPVYIIQGTNDATVTPANSQELYATLQSYGSDVTYISYGGGHEFTGLTQAQIDTLQMGAIQFIQGQFPVS